MAAADVVVVVVLVAIARHSTQLGAMIVPTKRFRQVSYWLYSFSQTIVRVVGANVSDGDNDDCDRLGSSDKNF